MKKNVLWMIAVLLVMGMQSMGVYVIGQLSVRETRKHIGRIRVRETLGSDISLCKVQKGGKEIKAAFDRGDAIVAISTD